MNMAARLLSGTHDFKAFEASGSPRSGTERTVTKAEMIRSTNHYVCFEIEANGFLRFMVRNIVGTLAEIGLGKRTADEIKDILRSCDRSKAGVTAPAHGLFLIRVEY
jgi:tRNA pseudouridine38-40 synthase